MTKRKVYCKQCGNCCHYYDKVPRKVRTSFGKSYWIDVERYFCFHCRTIHRLLPDTLIPYKHYEKPIIDGFVQEQYSCLDLEFEDYPCEMTVQNWKREFCH